MSHFYGTLQGQAGKATRRGSKNSGLTVTAASWDGAVSVDLYFDPSTGENRYRVYAHGWHGRGDSFPIAMGIIGTNQVKAA